MTERARHRENAMTIALQSSTVVTRATAGGTSRCLPVEIVRPRHQQQDKVWPKGRPLLHPKPSKRCFVSADQSPALSIISKAKHVQHDHLHVYHPQKPCTKNLRTRPTKKTPRSKEACDRRKRKTRRRQRTGDQGHETQAQRQRLARLW